jgi:hypothetical protein
MQWRRDSKRATTTGAYTPSVLVTIGILFLLSLGEDILEVWGEVRAVWVAAAILWGGDVGVCPGDPYVVLGRGLGLFLSTRDLLFNGSRTRSVPNCSHLSWKRNGQRIQLLMQLLDATGWMQRRKGLSQADRNVARGGSDNSSERGDSTTYLSKEIECDRCGV